MKIGILGAGGIAVQMAKTVASLSALKFRLCGRATLVGAEDC